MTKKRLREHVLSRLFRPLRSNHFSKKHEAAVGLFRIPDDIRQEHIEAYDEDVAWLGERLRLSYDDRDDAAL